MGCISRGGDLLQRNVQRKSIKNKTVLLKTRGGGPSQRGTTGGSLSLVKGNLPETTKKKRN